MAYSDNPYDYVNYSKNYNNRKEDNSYVPEKGTLAYKFGTTDHRCFIVELEERNGVREKLEIQFVPSSFGGARVANLQEIVIVGRNNPLLHYTTGNETITLPLEFYSDNERHDDVKKKIDWLRSLTINNGAIGGYRNVKIIFGDLFKWEIWAVKSVNYNYSHFDGKSGFLPLRATASIMLVLDTPENLEIDDFRL